MYNDYVHMTKKVERVLIAVRAGWKGAFGVEWNKNIIKEGRIRSYCGLGSTSIHSEDSVQPKLIPSSTAAHSKSC